ncbi:hypothetical protein [uncultured Paraglaciecola sp.]|uniref:hypothetical protein n=1 Tax=uncultured Paraglaciecola sp. TaxID=1765024 RepID=UPI0026205D3C|nr:hypothetical protein [uncultured Paraglaciecola sp.]
MIYGSVVPGSQVDVYWPQVKHWVEESIRRSKSYDTIDELYNYVKNSYPEFMLVLFLEKGKMVAVTIFQEDEKALNCVAFGGEGVLKQAPRLMTIWKAIANSLNLPIIKLTGRSGWGRVFKDDLIKHGDFYYGRSIRE